MEKMQLQDYGKKVPNITINEDLPTGTQIIIEEIGEIPMAAGRAMVQPHTHSYFFIHFVTSGSGIYEIDGASVPLHAGCVFMLPPHCVHNLTEVKSMKGYIIAFTEQFLSILDNRQQKNIKYNLFGPSPKCINVSSESALESILKAFSLEHQNEDKGAKHQILCSLLLSILYIINRDSALVLTENNNNYGLQFKELIEQHYLEHIPISGYAQIMGISTKTLTLSSIDYLGIPPQRAVVRRVIYEAKRILQYTSLSVKEISFHLGFKTAPHFQKFFKKETGQTPGEYRKAKQAGKL